MALPETQNPSPKPRPQPPTGGKPCSTVFYTGVFQSKVKNVYQRSVVFVLADGKIYGGNSLAFFKGSYSVDGDQITGTFTGKHYFGETFTVFGLIEPSTSFSLKFTAEIRGDELHGSAKRIDDPEQGVDFVFLKREDL